MIERSAPAGRPRVLSETMPGVASAIVAVWVPVGARDEDLGVEGSSHLLEHLVFKGTETRTQRQIAEGFDAVGGYANAFTTLEYTCYYAVVLGDDVPMATEILADMVCSPRLAADDLAKEKQVVFEELALLEDSPEELIHPLTRRHLFDGHRLGREILGERESLAALDADQLSSFHRDNYRGASMVVTAAGAVDHADMVDLGNKLFGASEVSPSRRQPPPNSQGSGEVLTRSTESAHIALSGFGFPVGDDRRYVWALIDDALGGGAASHLVQEIREERGLAYSTYSYRDAYSDAGMWAVYAGTSPANLDEVSRLIADELDKLATDGLSTEEIARTKGQMRGALLIEFDKPMTRAMRLGRAEICGEESLEAPEIVEHIDAIDADMVASVAEDLFTSDRTKTVIAP